MGKSFSRSQKAKYNIIVSLFGQIVTVICGLIVPQLLMKYYGSEAYGATTSIAQFLSYISLLDGGVSGVARAALYVPLANNDNEKIGAVLYQIKSFFRNVAYVLIVYVIVLSVSFKGLSHISSMDWIATALLVVSISISTFAQYFFGITYAIFLQAAQKSYVTNGLSIITTLLNTIAVLMLVYCGSNLIVVKLVSSCVFLIRPIFMAAYVKKNYPICEVKSSENALKDKWEGLGQHLAYFIHTNTDIALLTIIKDLTYVAVYSVYYMIVFNIQTFATSISSGMEALFGDMLAKKEHSQLDKVFGYYETLISMVSVSLFSTTIVMVIPFVRIYTSNITDANYIYRTFAIVLILASFLYCTRLPYHAVIMAAGHFKQTKVGAYGEAVINIVLSIICIFKFGLVGVAIGTFVATLFRFLFYVWYLSRHVMFRQIRHFIKRILVNCISILVIVLPCSIYISLVSIKNYFIWGCLGLIVFVTSVIISLVSNYICYQNESKEIIEKYVHKKK